MALITTSDLETYLGAGAGSYTAAQLQAAADQAGAAVESWCGRHFAAADYAEWLTPAGEIVSLPEYPVLAVYRVTPAGEQALKLTCTDASMVSIGAAVGAGKLVLTQTGNDTTISNSQSIQLASYNTLQTLMEAINLLSGWHADLMGIGGEPPDLRPTHATVPRTSAIYLEAPAPDSIVDAVLLEPDAGLLRWPWPSGTRSVFVRWRAGYETIPSDLADLLAALERPGNLVSERIGEYEYKLSDAAVASRMAKYSQLIEPYRRRSVL